ncbi:hypothetical protein [Methyloraptor flagellatus]|uniref:Uncharacterized protein n=1 Tax=Methyloraptor flagellatus TaxID=3162530 RepID=A0AAU7XCK1_9HYPH
MIETLATPAFAKVDDQSARIRSMALEIEALKRQVALLRQRDEEEGAHAQSIEALDLAEALVVNGGTQRVPAHFEVPAQANDAVFYGPYATLKEGLYRLSLDVEPVETVAVDNHLGLGVEVCYGDVVFARKLFRMKRDPQQDLYFVITKEQADLAPGQGFEFRMFSSGLLSFRVSRLSCRRIGNVREEASGPLEFFDIMWSQGKRGVHNGRDLLARSDSSGHVIYGPYTKVPAGRYNAVIRGRATSSSGTDAVVVDVHCTAGELANQSFAIEAGAFALELPFTIAPAASLEALPSRIEIRLEKREGLELQIAAVDLVRAG